MRTALRRDIPASWSRFSFSIRYCKAWFRKRNRPVPISELSGTLYSTYGYLGAAYQDVASDRPTLTIPRSEGWLNQPQNAYLVVSNVNEICSGSGRTKYRVCLNGYPAIVTLYDVQASTPMQPAGT